MDFTTADEGDDESLIFNAFNNKVFGIQTESSNSSQSAFINNKFSIQQQETHDESNIAV